MDIPADGGNNEGDGNGGDTDLNYLEAEYGCTIHCDAVGYGPLRTGHPAARRAGVSAVVVTDGIDLKVAREKAEVSAAETETEADSESED